MAQFNISPEHVISRAIHCGFAPGGCFGELERNGPTDFQQHLRSESDRQHEPAQDAPSQSARESSDDTSRTEEAHSSESSEPRQSTEHDTSSEVQPDESSEASQTEPTAEHGDVEAAADVSDDSATVNQLPIATEVIDTDIAQTTTIDAEAEESIPSATLGHEGDDAIDAPAKPTQAAESTSPQGEPDAAVEQVAEGEEDRTVTSRIVVDRYPVGEEKQPHGAAPEPAINTEEVAAVGALAASEEESAESPEEPASPKRPPAGNAERSVRPQAVVSTTERQPQTPEAAEAQHANTPTTGQEERDEDGRRTQARTGTERVTHAPKPGQAPILTSAATEAGNDANTQPTLTASASQAAGTEVTASSGDGQAKAEPTANPQANQARSDASSTAASGQVESSRAPQSNRNQSAERTVGGLTSIETSRFINRVARAFDFAQDRGGVLKLRLSPPELGSLRLEVTLKEGAVVARLETETTTAKTVLMDNLAQLKERLAEQNIRIETFDVDVNDQSSSHQGAEGQKEQEAGRTETRTPSGTSNGSEQDTAEQTTDSQINRHPNSELNLVA